MLRRASLWTWVGTVAAIGIVVVTTAAAVDHVRKTHAFRRASNSLWYCMHRGQQCGGTSPTAIEAAWMRRERVYKTADAALIVAGCVAVVAVRRRRR